MLYRISPFLMVGLLTGCTSSKDIPPVESGKVVMVKKWSQEPNPSITSVKKGDLNSVSLKTKDPWEKYHKAFGKNLETGPKAGREQGFGEGEHRYL